MKICIVTASRDWVDESFIFGKLDELYYMWPFKLLVHGGCKGGDLICDRWARNKLVHVAEIKALWHSYRGKSSGNYRNLIMLEAFISNGEDVTVIGFPKPQSRGTIDCLDKAKKLGFIVQEYTE